MNILLAEDDPHIRQGLIDMLTLESYQVSAAENGEIALALFRAHAFDLVILDVMMPKLDGYRVCKAIRQENELIPILFLTAKSEEIDKVVGLELGADDYISKPFGLAELRARIRAVMRRCQIPPATTNTPENFTFGNWQVNPKSLHIQHAETVHEITLRELKILQCFAQSPGEVISRDRLFDAAWGYDYLPNSRTLDQHISKLRKLIETEPSQPRTITTVHGQGYRYQTLD